MKNEIRPRLPKHLKKYIFFLKGLSEESAYQIFEGGTGLNFDVAEPPIEGLKVNSVWQSGDNWKVSYKATKETSKELFKSIRSDVLMELKDFRPKQPRIKRVKSKSKKLHLLSLSDIHFGKEPLEQTESRLNFVVDDLLSRLDKKKDKKFLLIVGNDILNTDFGQATTKGTPQFNYAEPVKVFRAAQRGMIRVIEKLLSIGVVHLVHVPSNHDYYRGTYLYDAICNRYYNNENVTYEEEIKDRQYYQFYNNAFMFEHGELRVNDYEVIFATEAPHIFCNTENREIILGHLHHEQVHQKRGCKIRFLPCISGADAWHKRKGYISPKQQQLFIYDAEKGLQTIHEVTV